MASRRRTWRGRPAASTDSLILLLLLMLAVTGLGPGLGRVSAKTGKNINTFAGPFVAYANMFSVCDSSGEIQLHLRNSHYNPAKPLEKQTITGNFTNTVDLNDAMWVRVRMDVRSNNQWKENAFVFNFPTGACSNIREHIPNFFHVMFKLGPQAENPRTPCLVPAAVYEVDRQPVDWVFPKFPVMPYGHYRFNIMIGKSKNTQACLSVDCSIIPKVNQ